MRSVKLQHNGVGATLVTLLLDSIGEHLDYVRSSESGRNNVYTSATQKLENR